MHERAVDLADGIVSDSYDKLPSLADMCSFFFPETKKYSLEEVSRRIYSGFALADH